MRSTLIAFFAVAVLSLGCASAWSIGANVCDTVLGGSKASKLCDAIEKKAQEAAEEAAASDAAGVSDSE